MPPRIEQATAAPGEYRPSADSDPPADLVRGLAAWLNRPESVAVAALRQLRFDHYAR